MRSREVLLTVKGFASNVDDEDGAMRMTTTATLTGNKSRWKLRYTELQPDTNEKHRITMTMDRGTVTMVRDGSFGTNMVFQKGRRYESSYNTPFGVLDMGIFPTQVRYDLQDNATGSVQLKYQLDIQGQYTSFHNLDLCFAPNEPETAQN